MSKIYMMGGGFISPNILWGGFKIYQIWKMALNDVTSCKKYFQEFQIVCGGEVIFIIMF